MEELCKISNKILKIIGIMFFIIPFLIIGLLIGVFCYANKTDVIGLMLLILFSVGGLTTGIFVLRWFLKNNRMQYIASANASRDIDDIVHNDKKK